MQAAKLSAGGVRDGSVLHMVLNDDPYVGKPLHIKSTSGQVRESVSAITPSPSLQSPTYSLSFTLRPPPSALRPKPWTSLTAFCCAVESDHQSSQCCVRKQVRTVYCGADFYVEDVKEELSYFVGEEPPEKTKLIFAGEATRLFRLAQHACLLLDPGGPRFRQEAANAAGTRNIPKTQTPQPKNPKTEKNPKPESSSRTNTNTRSPTIINLNSKNAPQFPNLTGRELQNQHTLREYNIQKPSVVIAISSGSSARDIACFVKSTEPPPDCNEVSTKAKIFCNFNSTEENETHFWGQMLGGPDFNSISSSEFSLVANLGTELPVPGRVSCDPNRHTVVFAPSQQLKPATRCPLPSISSSVLYLGPWLLLVALLLIRFACTRLRSNFRLRNWTRSLPFAQYFGSNFIRFAGTRQRSIRCRHWVTEGETSSIRGQRKRCLGSSSGIFSPAATRPCELRAYIHALTRVLQQTLCASLCLSVPLSMPLMSLKSG
jgi:hypothetical protein